MRMDKNGNDISQLESSTIGAKVEWSRLRSVEQWSKSMWAFLTGYVTSVSDCKAVQWLLSHDNQLVV